VKNFRTGKFQAVLAALVLCGACGAHGELAGRWVIRSPETGAGRALDSQRVAAAKAHPNAWPRRREREPAVAPSYLMPGFRLDLERRQGGGFADEDDVSAEDSW